MSDNNRYVFNADEDSWVDTKTHRFCDPIDVMNDQARALAEAEAENKADKAQADTIIATLRDMEIEATERAEQAEADLAAMKKERDVLIVAHDIWLDRATKAERALAEDHTPECEVQKIRDDLAAMTKERDELGCELAEHLDPKMDHAVDEPCLLCNAMKRTERLERAIIPGTPDLLGTIQLLQRDLAAMTKERDEARELTDLYDSALRSACRKWAACCDSSVMYPPRIRVAGDGWAVVWDEAPARYQPADEGEE